MADLLLLAGVLLCLLSLPLALIAVARTEAPRSAAASLVLGIALMFLAAWLAPGAFHLQDIAAAWTRLATARIDF
ncbi:hypothetical protein GI374_01990 [Paracoccus sp. S-4012]|uniref:hypothetical protein n=1 Tax=Paracoccus sp. S-4012 TaxID=2665648 RepID=UPI0012AFDC6A|nr:hypothetical protein [Paracoccus sp. S-4012]MRX49229.1 hypothetical protein [Paracoccus sp. S-4012]